MSPRRLQDIVAGFPRANIAVLGDYFLDKYLEVDPALAEVSVETGRRAHQVVAIRHSPGVAGTVICNLASLGTGRIHAFGIIGDDGEGYDLRKDLAALGCHLEHLHHARGLFTPTYLKPRDCGDPTLAGEHERYDTKNRRPTAPELVERIIHSLDALLPRLDAVIVADQVEEEECGVVTSAVREALADRASRWPKVVFWADSRRRIRRFRNVIIKPNQFEAVGHSNPLPGETIELDRLETAIRTLRQQCGAPVCITRGAAGMLVSDPEIIEVPAVRLEGPLDPTGAGDSATAGAVLALCAGATLPEAALVGNLVASITVQQLATTGVARPEQLLPRLSLWNEQQAG
jgi:rfaE bifunctional protein kinase chain/domain